MKQIEEFQKFPIIDLGIIKEEVLGEIEEDEISANSLAKKSQLLEGSSKNVKERKVGNDEMMNLKRIKSFYQQV